MGLEMYLIKKKKITRGCNLQDELLLRVFKSSHKGLKLNHKGFRKFLAIKDEKVSLTNKEIDKALISPLYRGECIGYWYKANHIHNYFIVNNQDGIDDQDSYEVSEEFLDELLSICNEVISKAKLKHINFKKEFGTKEEAYDYQDNINYYSTISSKSSENADKEIWIVDVKDDIIENEDEIKELLPTKSGFFFGSKRYDCEYLDSVKKTIDIIKKSKNIDRSNYYIMYSCWW